MDAISVVDAEGFLDDAEFFLGQAQAGGNLFLGRGAPQLLLEFGGCKYSMSLLALRPTFGVLHTFKRM